MAGGWLRYVNIAPDVFGYISSLTKGDEYFDEGMNGGVLDGLERTRQMGEVTVKVGDVRPMENIGLVAFASLDETVVGTLRQGRMYL